MYYIIFYSRKIFFFQPFSIYLFLRWILDHCYHSSWQTWGLFFPTRSYSTRTSMISRGVTNCIKKYNSCLFIKATLDITLNSLLPRLGNKSFLFEKYYLIWYNDILQTQILYYNELTLKFKYTFCPCTFRSLFIIYLPVHINMYSWHLLIPMDNKCHLQ